MFYCLVVQSHQLVLCIACIVWMYCLKLLVIVTVASCIPRNLFAIFSLELYIIKNRSAVLLSVFCITKSCWSVFFCKKSARYFIRCILVLKKSVCYFYYCMLHHRKYVCYNVKVFSQKQYYLRFYKNYMSFIIGFFSYCKISIQSVVFWIIINVPAILCSVFCVTINMFFILPVIFSSKEICLLFCQLYFISNVPIILSIVHLVS